MPLSSILERIRDSRIVRRFCEIRVPRVLVAKPSTTMIIIILIIASVFILGGGVYDIIESPMALLPGPEFPIFFHYGVHEQTWLESLIAFFLFAIGIIGSFLAFRSTRYAYKPREATILLLIGIVMIVVAYIGCEYLLVGKLQGSVL